MAKRRKERKTGHSSDQWFKLKTKHQNNNQTSRRSSNNNGDDQMKWTDPKSSRTMETQKPKQKIKE